MVLAIGGASYWITTNMLWPEPPNPIAQWGTGPGGTKGDVYVAIETGQLGAYKNDYRLLILWCVQDARREMRDDPRIDKSELFDITDERKWIVGTISEANMARLIPRGGVTVYALAVPRTLRPSDIQTINAGVDKGAMVLGARSFLANAIRQ